MGIRVVVAVGTMMSKTLSITHPNFDFSSVNRDSILLTDRTQSLTQSRYHTSLGELSVRDIITVAKLFDCVEFVPENFNPHEAIFNETQLLLTYLSHYILVKNFTPVPPLTFTNFPTINDSPETPVLWVFGCSHSAGVGLVHNKDRYSEIVADQLNTPLNLIAKAGTSLHWSLRHLVAADIQEHDYVIWQVTMPGRVSLFDGDNVIETILSRTNNRHLLEVYTEHQTYFTHLSLLWIGVNYLRAKNVKFRVVTMEPNPDIQYRTEYLKYPEYCYVPDYWVDYGTDGGHAGPLSNKLLASAIVDHIQYNNE